MSNETCDNCNKLWEKIEILQKLCEDLTRRNLTLRKKLGGKS